MKKLVLLLALVFPVFIVACAPTETSRSTGQTFDDAGTTARVKTAIAKNMSVSDAAGINVDTYRGVVSLAGFVDSNEKKQQAGAAAKGVSGVERVINNLTLKSKP